jgi:hypothetical protein
VDGRQVIAVDFGTTATCVATCTGAGADPQVVTHPGPKSSRLPSGVMWWEGQLLVGSAAYNRGSLDPAAYDETPKRSLSQGDGSLLLGGREVALTDVLAAVLSEAARPALAQLGDGPASWVVTHPAVWGPAQLEVLSAAAARAGAGKVTLLAEPVAAAWAMRREGLPPGARVAVFDWGGGTFDAAVLVWDGASFTPAGPPAGEDPLGGEDVDFAVEQLVLPRLPDEIRKQVEAPASSRDRRLGRELRYQARIAKEELSGASYADLTLLMLEEPLRVTLAEFTAVAGPFIERCADVLRRCLAASGVQPGDLAAVYLVGDSSRIPLVHRVLEDRYPGVLIVPADLGKEAVARGAALAAASGALAGHPRPPRPAPQPTATAAATATSYIAVNVEGLVTAVQRRLPREMAAGEMAIHLTAHELEMRQDSGPGAVILARVPDARRALVAAAIADPAAYPGDRVTAFREAAFRNSGHNDNGPFTMIFSPHGTLEMRSCEPGLVSELSALLATARAEDPSWVNYRLGLSLPVPAGFHVLREQLALFIRSGQNDVAFLRLSIGPEHAGADPAELARDIVAGHLSAAAGTEQDEIDFLGVRAPAVVVTIDSRHGIIGVGADLGAIGCKLVFEVGYVKRFHYWQDEYLPYITLDSAGRH